MKHISGYKMQKMLNRYYIVKPKVSSAWLYCQWDRQFVLQPRVRILPGTSFWKQLHEAQGFKIK